jgi:spore maturation protein CgeB
MPHTDFQRSPPPRCVMSLTLIRPDCMLIPCGNGMDRVFPAANDFTRPASNTFCAMRFLVINHDYPQFQRWFYSSIEDVDKKSYEELMALRHASLFGLAGFYASNLKRLGHEAWDVRVNDEILQKTWARENGVVMPSETAASREARGLVERFRRLGAHPAARRLKPILRPVVRRLSGDKTMYSILKAQIEHYRPEVILNQAVDRVSDEFLAGIKNSVRLVVGQIAAPLPERQTFEGYDLMISSLPNYVNNFRKQGLKSELSRLAFEPSVLDGLGPGSRTFGATFVGSFTTSHHERADLLRYLCQAGAIDLWGENFHRLPKNSPILARYRGKAWGLEMFRILRDSRIAINHHIGIAGDYANNMRLFEATGVGTLLLTDEKVNLGEMFEIDKEVVSYRTPEECLEKIRYYLSHDRERETIARAGQQRTLKEHTYARRLTEFVALANFHLRSSQIRVTQ